MDLDRDATGDLLRSRMVDPWSLVGFPVVRAKEGPGAAAFRALANGQAVSVSGVEAGCWEPYASPKIASTPSAFDSAWGDDGEGAEGAFYTSAAVAGLGGRSGVEEVQIVGIVPPKGHEGAVLGVVAGAEADQRLRPIRVLVQ